MCAYDTGPNQSAAWAALVVILLVLIAVVLVGYFAWWAPVHRAATVIQPPERGREVLPAPAPQQPAPEPEQPTEQPAQGE